ncbi:MAG: sensor protein KdpD [Bacteroidota bacterium]
MYNKENNAQYFLDLIKKSRRGKFKIYIGMIAGVGKTYRMLQDAHSMLKNGIDVKIGYVETHQRAETIALIEGLPIISRQKSFYKGKEFEEMDVQAIINQHPEVVIVDELAHTNIEGSVNQKRWQDVMDILNAGINVISAVNIQHIESLNETVKSITNIDITERIPDSVLMQADEVVNIDLTADELISRLKEGKIYQANKIQTALNNFFKIENILQLRELALKEVAAQVVRKVEKEIPKNMVKRHERFMACISSNEKVARLVIRKTARLANYYNSTWYVLYVQTNSEQLDKISLSKQRHLLKNFELATELGGKVIKAQNNSIVKEICNVSQQHQITTLCIGKPQFTFFRIFFSIHTFNQLLKSISLLNIDIIILS